MEEEFDFSADAPQKQNESSKWKLQEGKFWLNVRGKKNLTERKGNVKI